MHPRILAGVSIAAITLSILMSCTPSANAHAAAEAYIRAHVSELSPVSAVLGGTFRVTDITWEDNDTAVVSYEDGHIALKGRADVQKDGDTVTVTQFTILDTDSDDSSSSSSAASSVKERPRAKEGELCGGIAGILCEPQLRCQYKGAYPDAAGTCVK